jgi:serine/threonine protein phosphatase PrpC
VENAVCDTVDIEEGDLIAVLSDGVTDNLWEHEICEKLCTGIEGLSNQTGSKRQQEDGIVDVATQLMESAREIAQDPNAESPYMERAFDEGIAAEGGKLDDISVVLGICRRRES